MRLGLAAATGIVTASTCIKRAIATALPFQLILVQHTRRNRTRQSVVQKRVQSCGIASGRDDHSLASQHLCDAHADVGCARHNQKLTAHASHVDGIQFEGLGNRLGA